MPSYIEESMRENIWHIAGGQNFYYKNPLRQIVHDSVLSWEEFLLRNMESLSQDEKKQYIVKNLEEFITHAYRKVPLYHSLYDARGLFSRNIGSLQDLEKFPIVTKRDFRELAIEEKIARNVSMRRALPMVTSGSTGEPFSFFSDKKYWLARRALTYRTWRWAGVDPHELLVQCTIEYAHTPNHIFFPPDGIWKKSKKYMEDIKKSRARILWGYPLITFELAKMLLQEGGAGIQFPYAFFAGHIMPSGMRDFFKTNFGSEVYMYYGAQEIGVMATECSFHEGYHVNEERVFIEIIDGNNQPCTQGKVGRIIVTSFLNEIMPLIRYEIGDLGFFLDSPCLCGRSSPRIMVQGRYEDLLLRPDGTVISPSILRNHILDLYFHLFERYQVEQISPQVILLRIVRSDIFQENQFLNVINKLQALAGPHMKIEYEYVDRIEPLPNGKFQYFISPFWRQGVPPELLKT